MWGMARQIGKIFEAPSRRSPLATVVAVLLGAQLHVAEANRLIYGLNVLLLLAFGMLVGNHVIGAPTREAAGAPLGAWSPWLGVILVSLGFFLHFSAPARSLPWLLLVLFAVWGAQATGTALAGGLAGAFLGGLVVTPAAYFVQSRRGGPPAQVTFLPSFWMLVPGALGLTGVSQLVLLGSKASLNEVTQALLTIVAISLGMMVGASLLQTAAKPSSWLDAPPPPLTRAPIPLKIACPGTA